MSIQDHDFTPEVPDGLPEPVDGVDFNFCRNPRCRNFGLSAHAAWQQFPVSRKGGSDEYAISASGKGKPNFRCKRCGKWTSQRSNAAIMEEYNRISGYLKEKIHSCPHSDCSNHGKTIALGSSHYHYKGDTPAGSPRYFCKACRRTFSISRNATARQRVTSFNISVLKSLTNGMPLRRVLRTEKKQLKSPPTLYRRIDFLAEQARKFSANRERKLLRNIHLVSAEECRQREARYTEKGLPVPDWNIPATKLYLSTDCMDLITNWRCTADKRTVMLRLVATAEVGSGYILAANVAYDPTLDPAEVEEEALACHDYSKKHPLRRFARVWLQKDYDAALSEAPSERQVTVDESWSAEVEKGTQLPLSGMQVRIEYAMYAHFLLLRRLTEGASKVRFYLDPDPGMDNACMSVFRHEILDKTCEVFTVSYRKDCTDPQRLQYVNIARRELGVFRQSSAAYTDLHLHDLAVILMTERVRASRDSDNPEPYIPHALPKKSEPWKEVCWRTNLGDRHYDGEEEHLARLYLKASLHSTDNFFQRLRRGVHFFERPIATASSQRCMWYGYSPYNPKWLVQMLDIYRAVYNYVEVGEDGKTPAMRLGLAKVPLDYEDIIRFIEPIHGIGYCVS